MTRRDFAKLAAAPVAVPCFAAIDSKFSGVMIGAQTYSFRTFFARRLHRRHEEIGLGYAELWDGHILPKDRSQQSRPGARIRPWTRSAAFARSSTTRASISTPSTTVFATNSPTQIEQGFLMAKAMGVKRITASANVDISPRVDKYAEQYKIYVGYHNHDSMKPNEFSTPDDWKTGAGGPLEIHRHQSRHRAFHGREFRSGEFLEEHHAKIVTLHIKDRKKDHGPNMPLGQGDTNIKGVLEVLKTKKYPIPAMIEYEYGKPGWTRSPK
jgi:hypothetical protein